MSISDVELMEIRRELQQIRAMLEIIPLEGGGGGAAEITIYEILEGQLLPPANIQGIKWITPEVTIIDDDPDVPGVRGDGMGIAQDVATGTKIMVVHDVSAPYGTQAALRDGDFGISIGTRTSPDGTVYHYIARF